MEEEEDESSEADSPAPTSEDDDGRLSHGGQFGAVHKVPYPTYYHALFTEFKLNYNVVPSIILLVLSLDEKNM